MLGHDLTLMPYEIFRLILLMRFQGMDVSLFESSNDAVRVTSTIVLHSHRMDIGNRYLVKLANIA